MSEQPETAAPAAGEYIFTPEQLAAARDQLLAQGELDPAESGGGPPVGPGELGAQALADGAEAAEADPGAMLRAIQALQAQVDALNAEKRATSAPPLVTYAQAVKDHLAAKQAAHPVIDADPDHSFAPAVELAGQLVDAAKQAGEPGGDTGPVTSKLAEVETWIKQHAKRFPQLDYSYLGDLALEVAGTVAKLAA